MSEFNPDCCPKFDPEPWDEKEFRWDEKRFVKDHVSSLFHIPLNYHAVMKRNIGAIEAADVRPENMIVLTDENSLWGADVYLEVTKDLPEADMVSIDGDFLSKVFEGSYKNIKQWTEEMKSFVQSRGKTIRKLYYYYTTCPKCARKYGKNYVAILALV